MAKITLTQGDITQIKADAIVNAANTSLMGGGGVDGAIHRAAGPELRQECALLNGCRTGEAKITSGYLLPARYVIHAVGPIWNGGNKSEPELLYAAYKNSLLTGQQNGVRIIAFPNISTGVYNYPREEAATIAISAVNDYISQHSNALDEVIFVCFDDDNYLLYQQLLGQANI